MTTGIPTTDVAAQGPAQFLDIARQTQAAVSQHPENYDLTGICQAVLKEVAAFHPNVPRRSTEAAAVYCATWKGQSASTYSCSGTRFPQALGGTDLFQNRTFQLRHVTAYTGYCLGRTLDGILFQPTGTSQGQSCSERARFQFSYDSSSCNPGQPDPDTTRVIQFVSTDCSTCTGKTYSTGSECRALHGHVYYLDSMLHENDSSSHDGIPYLHPDVYQSARVNGVARMVHFISDEPTANMPEGQGSQCDQNPVGAPMTKSFYDFLMCRGQVLEVFRWSRTGKQAPVLHGGRTESSAYSAVEEVSPADVPHLFNGLCDADNIHWYSNNADLQAIGKAMQCSWLRNDNDQ